MHLKAVPLMCTAWRSKQRLPTFRRLRTSRIAMPLLSSMCFNLIMLLSNCQVNSHRSSSNKACQHFLPLFSKPLPLLHHRHPLQMPLHRPSILDRWLCPLLMEAITSTRIVFTSALVCAPTWKPCTLIFKVSKHHVRQRRLRRRWRKC